MYILDEYLYGPLNPAQAYGTLIDPFEGTLKGSPKGVHGPLKECCNASKDLLRCFVRQKLLRFWGIWGVGCRV